MPSSRPTSERSPGVRSTRRGLPLRPSGLQTRLLLTALVIVVIILFLVYRGPLL
ncbi:MAG: hypothetical protein WAU75_22135 [Solirubrobacteraceae bacterium]